MIEQKQITTALNLATIYSKYFTQNPYVTHTVPSDSTDKSIKNEKLACSARLNEQALKFNGSASQELALTSIQLMQEFHHNQFRSGSPTLHYTNHTEKVAFGAYLAAKELAKSQSPEILYTEAGEALDPEAVAFALGSLHDSLEDFYKNFRETDLEITPELASQIAVLRIQEKLTPVIGTAATEKFISLIQILSLTNDDEFPTQEYVGNICQNFYTISVKRADYNHNLQTFPTFTPAYPLLIVPAQYQPIIANSEFTRSYAEGLILNLAVFNPDEIVPWSSDLMERGIKTVEHLMGLFERYNELGAVDRITKYYDSLKVALEQGHFNKFLELHNLSMANILTKIDQLYKTLVPSLA